MFLYERKLIKGGTIMKKLLVVLAVLTVLLTGCGKRPKTLGEIDDKYMDQMIAESMEDSCFKDVEDKEWLEMALRAHVENQKESNPDANYVSFEWKALGDSYTTEIDLR
jgi:major membrane immunogen (membrane-anchored lipoprotein)